MKYIITITTLLFATFSFGQGNLSTLKLGEFSLKMSQQEAEKLAGRKLITPSESNNYNYESHVIYKGEQIKIGLTNDYWNPNNSESFGIQSLSTSSKYFRTKSNMGVGSTRSELINAYKDFTAFSVYPGYNDNGERDSSLSYFNLEDYDAGTNLQFKMKNNIVVEVHIFYNEGGC